MKKKNPVKQLLGYTTGRKEKMLSIILSVISVLGGILPYFAMGRLAILLLQQNFYKSDMIELCCVIFLGYLTKTVCYIAATTISHKMAYEVMSDMRCMLLDKLKRISLGHVQEKTTGDYKQIMMDEVEHVEKPLAHILPDVTSNLAGFILILISLFVTEWRMALASLGTLLIGFLIYGCMMSGKDVKAMMNKYITDSASMTGSMLEYVNGMEVIKAFGQTASSMKRFESDVNSYKDSMNTWFAHCYPYLAAFYSVAPCCLLFILPIGSLLLVNQSITLSSFLTCLFLSLGLAEPLIKLIEFTDNLIDISTTMGKVNEIMNLPELEEGTAKVSDAAFIEAENVTFSYKDKEVLHDINFHIKRGQKIAFVGASGSGKSTIAKLLVRFYDVNNGRIKLDGTDIRDITLDNLMEKISFVTQDDFLFKDSILENIRIGDLSADENRITEAAKRAGCHEFITKLKKGYQTIVGDIGAGFSGGEKQRISIARAILKDSPIVVFDEATAHMDPENEDKIQRSLEELLKEKTMIMIAHRLSTVVHSDCIYVMDSGRISNYGTHKELLQNCEWYKKMWSINQKEEEL